MAAATTPSMTPNASHRSLSSKPRSCARVWFNPTKRGIPISLGTTGPTLKEFGSNFPSVLAFVVTEPKSRAEVQLYSIVEGEKVPILVSWNHGLGKAVAFTSDATNRWAPDWVKWPSYKKFWSNLFTWVSRQRMPSNHTITTRLEGNVGHVVVEGLDARGDYLNFAKLTGNALDPEGGRNGADGKVYELNFEVTAPGRYEATFPVEKPGAYSITVIDQSDPRKPNTMVSGLANSYSAEFSHEEGSEALLSQLGAIATGTSSVNHLKNLGALLKTKPEELGVFAHDLTPARESSDLFWPLIVLALCLFPFDVAVRRLSLDPERGYEWLAARVKELLIRAGIRKRGLQAAAAGIDPNKLAGVPPGVEPLEIVPSGAASREAQSRYETAGDSEAARNMPLNPQATGDKPVVGGTKVTSPDDSASDYTRALLKAKKRAKKK